MTKPTDLESGDTCPCGRGRLHIRGSRYDEDLKIQVQYLRCHNCQVRLIHHAANVRRRAVHMVI